MEKKFKLFNKDYGEYLYLYRIFPSPLKKKPGEGKEKYLYYFSKRLLPTALEKVPDGYCVVQSSTSKMFFIKKLGQPIHGKKVTKIRDRTRNKPKGIIIWHPDKNAIEN